MLHGTSNDQAACSNSKDAASSQHFLGCPILQLVNRWRSPAQQRQPDDNEVGNREWGPYNKQLHHPTQPLYRQTRTQVAAAATRASTS